jgi:BolA protein
VAYHRNLAKITSVSTFLRKIMSIASVIETKLLSAFSPLHLDVVNESNNHNVPPGSESHFKVIIVSNHFEEERLIKRHRAVNTILAVELAEKIHALALHTYTEKEWHEHYEANTPLSPNCLGGGK